MTILILFLFFFSILGKKKIGFYKLFFRFFLFLFHPIPRILIPILRNPTLIPRISTLISRIPILIPRIPRVPNIPTQFPAFPA